jgi:hypothetical protein
MTEISQHVGMAIDGYHASYTTNDPTRQLIDLCICLEALLLREDQELAFRLATRAANLLGESGAERKALYRDSKEFYATRSKVVHGSILAERSRNTLTRVDELRDLVRRLVRSIIALEATPSEARDIHDLLDEISLDESVGQASPTSAPVGSISALGGVRAENSFVFFGSIAVGKNSD